MKTPRINEETASYDEVKAALNGHYAARRNVIVERALFNKRTQTPVESVDTFNQDLYRLADNCGYGTIKDKLICDRIIVGVLDDTLSDRLQAKDDLTLEARKQNLALVRGERKASKSAVPTWYDARTFSCCFILYVTATPSHVFHFIISDTNPSSGLVTNGFIDFAIF